MTESKGIFTTAIILAAGIGSRLGTTLPKQKVELLGKSLLSRVVEPFLSCEDVDSIVVVTRREDLDFAKQELHFASSKIYSITTGGSSRAESAKLGFGSIPKETTHILIHDGARCLINRSDISKVIVSAIKYGAASAVKKVSDTVKLVDGDIIKSTISRDNLMLAQTPQAFERKLYEKALSSAGTLDDITDDNMLIENIGESIRLVELSFENPKITYASDLEYAEFLLKRREANE